MRAADSTSVLSTFCRSNVDLLMTWRTSEVAVCCWRDSAPLRSSLEQPRVLDGNDGLISERLRQLDFLFGKWVRLSAAQPEDTNRLPSRRSGTPRSKVADLCGFFVKRIRSGHRLSGLPALDSSAADYPAGTGQNFVDRSRFSTISGAP